MPIFGRSYSEQANVFLDSNQHPRHTSAVLSSGYDSGHFSYSSTAETASLCSMSDNSLLHELTTNSTTGPQLEADNSLRKVKSAELDRVSATSPSYLSSPDSVVDSNGGGAGQPHQLHNSQHQQQHHSEFHPITGKFPSSQYPPPMSSGRMYSLDMMSTAATNNNNNNVVDVDALSSTSSGIVTQCSSIPSPAGGQQQPPSFPHSQMGFQNFQSQQFCDLFGLLDLNNQQDSSLSSSMGMQGMGPPSGMMNRMSMPPQQQQGYLHDDATTKPWNMPSVGDDSLFQHQQSGMMSAGGGNNHSGIGYPPGGKRAITGAHNQMRGAGPGGVGGAIDLWKSGAGPMPPGMGGGGNVSLNGGSGGGGGVSPSSSSSVSNNPWSRAVANQKLGLAPVPVNSGLMGGGGMMQQRKPGAGDNGLDADGLDMFNMLSGMTGAPGREEQFSRKVFVGGLPPDIDEEEITDAFRRFGPLVVDWPHKVESKSYFPPKGYCFLLFQDERYVQSLTEACIVDNGKYYWCVSSATIRDKPVQIRPWCLGDSDYVMDGSQPLDPRKTIFVGGVPRPLRACELAMIMGRLYGGVCYAGIDTDPELRYPKGAGRVAFSSQQSYIAAISARFVHLQHGDMDKRVEVKPYVLDDQMCDECHGARCAGKFAPFFCANVTCLQYYCEQCWAQIHSRQGRDYHKPLVKEGADRPRTVPFRY